MKPQFKYRNRALLLALAALYPLGSQAAAAGAARVEFVTGDVVAINAAGVQRDLARGAELEAGDAIRTGANSRAQLRFSDGGMMSIQPGTEFHIDKYKFDGKDDGTERGFFSLVKGGLRAISGAIGHGKDKDAYRLNTPVATIGIRGTEYFVIYTGGKDGQLSVRTGEGAIVVQNAGGAIVLPSGGAAVVTGSDSKPQETNTFIMSSGTSAAPAVVTVAAAPVATTENRTEDGALTALTNIGALTSGSNYSVVIPNGSLDVYSPVAATFGPNSVLTAFNDTFGGTYTATGISFAASADGVIGWGNWTSSTYLCSDCSSAISIPNTPYVVGVPADLTNLTGTVATYNTVLGYTTPTSTTGATFNGNFSASLVANLSASNVTAIVGGVSTSIGANSVAGSVNLQMTDTTSTTYNISGVFSGSLTGSTFSNASGTTSTLAVGSSGSAAIGSMQAGGLLAGANVSHAGFVYQMSPSTGTLGTITGAVALKQ